MCEWDTLITTSGRDSRDVLFHHPESLYHRRGPRGTCFRIPYSLLENASTGPVNCANDVKDSVTRCPHCLLNKCCFVVGLKNRVAPRNRSGNLVARLVHGPNFRFGSYKAFVAGKKHLITRMGFPLLLMTDRAVFVP